MSKGRLNLYIDLQNVYDRGNVAGFDFEVDEEVGLMGQAEEWAGFLPSAGVRWTF